MNPPSLSLRNRLNSISFRVAGLLGLTAIIIFGTFAYTWNGMGEVANRFDHLINSVSQADSLSDSLTTNYLQTTIGVNEILSVSSVAEIRQKHEEIRANTSEFVNNARSLAATLPQTEDSVESLLTGRTSLDQQIGKVVEAQVQSLELEANNQSGVARFNSLEDEVTKKLQDLISLINMFASDYPVVIEAQNLAQTILSIQNIVSEFMSVRDTAALDKLEVAFNDQYKEGIATLETLSLMVEDEQTREDIASIRSSYENWINESVVNAGLFASRRQQLENRARAVKLTQDTQEIIAGMDKTISEIDSLTQESMRDSGEATNRMVVQVNSAISIGVVVAAVAFVLLALLLLNVVIKPINAITRRVLDIAEGEGDLTQRIRIKSQGEIANLAAHFNTFVSRIQELITHIRDASENMLSNCSELNSCSHNTTAHSESQREETGHLLEDMSALSDSVDTVSHSSEQAIELAEKTGHIGAQTKQLVADSISAIEALAVDISQGAEIINNLGAEIENIDSVINVINSIAEQTNLLALNAAIEAARAGEQGRGFAVVADEVRTLASRTQESTADIQAMIEKLQQGSKKAITFMQQSKVKGDETVEEARSAGTHLDEMVSALNNLREMNHEITSATQQQRQLTGSVNQRISAVEGISRETDQEAQRSAGYSEEMNSLSQQLSELVHRFKI